MKMVAAKGVRRLSLLKFLVFLTSAAMLSTSAYATTITYAVSNLHETTWNYDYAITNDTLPLELAEFTIFFDRGLYANLTTIGTPAQWDSLVVQPDSNIPDNGFFDSLALSNGLARGNSIKGFSVSFDWLGVGIPGSQTFNVVDPHTFAVLDVGRTSPVPEPNTLLLFSLGLLGLFLYSPSLCRLRKRCPTPSSASPLRSGETSAMCLGSEARVPLLAGGTNERLF